MGLPPKSENGTALVTGASAGIGVEFAKRFAELGYGVTLVARREDRLNDLKIQLEQEHGVRAEAVAADLSDAGSREALVSEVANRGLTVEILVNNAGFGTRGLFSKLDRGTELREIATNVEALSDLTSVFLPGMVERDRGGVINIASTAAFQPVPYMATYGGTKAFVRSFSEAIHSELAGTGVNCLAVCPGPVRTEFAEIAGNQEPLDRLPDLAVVDASDIAKQAIDYLGKGKRELIPGFVNKAQVYSAMPIPQAIKLRAVGRIFKTE